MESRMGIGRRRNRWLSGLILAGALCCAGAAAAQPVDNPFTKACREYRTPADFVRQAGLHCLQQGGRRGCDSRSAAYFQECRFDGNYSTIAAKVHSELLLLVLIGSARGVGPVRSGRNYHEFLAYSPGRMDDR